MRVQLYKDGTFDLLYSDGAREYRVAPIVINSQVLYMYMYSVPLMVGSYTAVLVPGP